MAIDKAPGKEKESLQKNIFIRQPAFGFISTCLIPNAWLFWYISNISCLSCKRISFIFHSEHYGHASTNFVALTMPLTRAAFGAGSLGYISNHVLPLV